MVLVTAWVIIGDGPTAGRTGGCIFPRLKDTLFFHFGPNEASEASASASIVALSDLSFTCSRSFGPSIQVSRTKETVKFNFGVFELLMNAGFETVDEKLDGDGHHLSDRIGHEH